MRISACASDGTHSTFWAFTIHKSQGITLLKAVVDLGSCWEDGQVYVALSRVKSFDGLYIRTLDRRCIVANAAAKVEMERLRNKIA